MPQSAAAPSPFTPIAEYGFLSDCHTGALIAPDGTIDWLCLPRFDSPSVFGATARPRRGRLSPRPVRDQRAERSDLRARNEHAGHVLEDAFRLGHRRAKRSRWAPAGRGHGHAPHAAAGRRGRRAHAGARRRVRGGHRRDRARVRPRLRLRPRARRMVALERSPSRRGDRRRTEDDAPDRHAARDRGQSGSRSARAAGGRGALLRARLGRRDANAHRRTSRRPTTGSMPPASSGATGWPGPGSPITSCGH